MTLQVYSPNYSPKQRILLYFLCFLILNFFSLRAHSQITLSPGDMSVLGLNGDSPDGFAVVNWVALSAGDKIHFTDKGWTNDNDFSTASVDSKETYTVPSAGVAAGTVLTSVNMGFSHDIGDFGDQILIYQTSDGNVNSSPIFSNWSIGKKNLQKVLQILLNYVD